MREIFLTPKIGEVQRNIKEADEFVKKNYPLDQPYLYTPKGNPIIFKSVMGFLGCSMEDK